MTPATMSATWCFGAYAHISLRYRWHNFMGIYYDRRRGRSVINVAQTAYLFMTWTAAVQISHNKSDAQPYYRRFAADRLVTVFRISCRQARHRSHCYSMTARSISQPPATWREDDASHDYFGLSDGHDAANAVSAIVLDGFERYIYFCFSHHYVNY